MPENILDDAEFTDEQLLAAVQRVGPAAREEAFAAGRPVFIFKGNKVVALYSDGSEKVVEPASQERAVTPDHE